ncbi:MAG: hypothetical protein ACE3L7_28560 [Candidatus Pristimantibacillus sp.]
MKKILLFLTSVTLAIFIAGCSKTEKIEIHTPAYMYNTDSSVNQKATVVLNGFYNHSKGNFEGSMTINDVNFSTILFVSSMGLVAYDGTERTFVGQIYYNNETKQFTIEVSNSELYYTLTKQEYQEEVLIISSPAEDLEQAMQINEALKKQQSVIEK